MKSTITTIQETAKEAVEAACMAIRNRRAVEVIGGGTSSLVFAHAVGEDTEGRVVLYGHEMRLDKDFVFGWRVFYFDDLLFIRIIERKSKAPLAGYNRSDSSIIRMYEEVS